MRLPEGKAWWWLTGSSGRSLMGFSSVSWAPCASTLRAGPLQTPQRGTDPARRGIMDSLWPGGPSAVWGCWIRFFLEHVGRLGFTPLVTVVGTLRTQWNGSLQPADGHGPQIRPWHRLCRPASSSLSQTSLVSFSLFHSSFLHKIKKCSSTYTFDLGFVTEFINILFKRLRLFYILLSVNPVKLKLAC